MKLTCRHYKSIFLNLFIYFDYLQVNTLVKLDLFLFLITSYLMVLVNVATIRVSTNKGCYVFLGGFIANISWNNRKSVMLLQRKQVASD